MAYIRIDHTAGYPCDVGLPIYQVIFLEGVLGTKREGSISHRTFGNAIRCSCDGPVELGALRRADISGQ